MDSTDFCWVYVLVTKGKLLSIEMAVNIKQRLGELNMGNEHYRLIYCRLFTNTISALGHKLLLEHLSHQSVMRIIKKENPGLLDLRSSITV